MMLLKIWSMPLTWDSLLCSSPWFKGLLFSWGPMFTVCSFSVLCHIPCSLELNIPYLLWDVLSSNWFVLCVNCSFEFSSWGTEFFNSIFISSWVCFHVSTPYQISFPSPVLSLSWPSALCWYFLGITQLCSVLKLCNFGELFLCVFFKLLKFFDELCECPLNSVSQSSSRSFSVVNIFPGPRGFREKRLDWSLLLFGVFRLRSGHMDFFYQF